MSPGSRFGPLQNYYYIYLPEINPVTFIAAEIVSCMSRDIECWFHRDPRVHTRSYTQFYSESDQIPKHKHTINLCTPRICLPLRGQGAEMRWGRKRASTPPDSSVWNRTKKEREIIKPNSLSFIQYLHMRTSKEKKTICGRTDKTESKERSVCVCLCVICSHILKVQFKTQ